MVTLDFATVTLMRLTGYFSQTVSKPTVMRNEPNDSLRFQQVISTV